MSNQLRQKIVDGRTDLVFTYIQKGGDASNRDGGVPLIAWCAFYGDVSAIRYLISQGASLENLGDNYDLNGAAFHGHWQLCQYLIEQGADPNYPLPSTGEVPLHACICKANWPPTQYIVELLLGHGADPNIKTKPGIETGGFMRDVFTRSETPLHRAAAFADEKTISMLLDAGAEKTARDAHDESPLSWASWHLRPGSILALLTHGPHQLHPLHVERMQSDHGFGWASGMYLSLLGKVHL